MSATEETKPEPKTWRVAPNIWLEQQTPCRGELERWETGVFGPHPCQVVLIKITASQWGASLNRSVLCYGNDSVQALDAARSAAIDNCDYMIERLQQVEFW